MMNKQKMRSAELGVRSDNPFRIPNSEFRIFLRESVRLGGD